MIEWFLKVEKPFTQALIAFSISVGILLVVALTVDFSGVHLGGLLFLASFVCCALIAKSVYDTAVTNSQADEMRRELVSDVSFSAKDLYTQLYQNSPVPYLLIDYDGNVTSANLAAGRIFGLSQTKIKGLNVFDYIMSAGDERLDMLVEKFRNGIPMSDEMVRVVRDDGSVSWALLSLFNFVDSFGDHMGMLTLVDITKQKQIEDAKSEFVSLASHQLRTPIAGIKWSAELLQLDAEKTLNDRQKKYIDRLLTGVSRMAVLVDDFLRVSRFELGTFQPEFTTVNLPALISSVVSEQAPRVAQKRIEVKTFFDESITNIISDQNLLRMIVTNLYSNAVKYTREGGTVHVGFGKKDDELVISVADNGMGIPVSDQERIFSKLFRASNAVRNVPDGTGLGLYIVKEAVDVLKGRVSFNSVENVGTTFEIVLPLEVSKETAIIQQDVS